MRLRTHEVTRDGMVTAAVYLAWSKEAASTEDAFAGVLHCDESLYLELIDALSERGRRAIDRGTCTQGCTHASHVGDRCDMADTVMPDGTETCCGCPGNPAEHATPAEQEEWDRVASYGAEAERDGGDT